MNCYQVKTIKNLLEHKFTIVALIWTAIIFILCLITLKNVSVDVPIQGKDKLVHFMFYFILVYLWGKALNDTKIILIVCFCVLYGIIIEVLQGVFTTTREFDIYDIIANLLGALTSFFVITKKNISTNY